MRISFAPLEGISSAIFRQAHAQLFGGVEEYFAPFIAPDGNGKFKAGNLRDILPENNRGIRVVPQLLVNRPEPFLQVAEILAGLGYEEVNLNIGCPSGTVVAKHKGAGMLLDLCSLAECLDEIYAHSPIKVSIKTRMGVQTTEEFAKILELYNRYPLPRLIVHARARAGMYKSRVDVAGFQSAMALCRCPLWYNGDVFSPAAIERLGLPQEGIAGLMLGRGAVADPALPRQLRGGPPLEKWELKNFHDTLLERFLSAGLSPHVAMARLKELWFYMLYKFPESRREAKQLLKAQSLTDYTSAVELLFARDSFSAGRYFSQPSMD